jgi:multiple sugar transport system ATP-binding protein
MPVLLIARPLARHDQQADRHDEQRRIPAGMDTRGMSGLVLSHITKSFGAVSVLRDVSLEIADGEFLTLLGPSGCGKSTLLRVLAGLEVQDGGQVAIGGRIVDRVRPKRRDVAMVFQSYALYPHMTVAENMALPLRMRRLSSWQRLPVVGRLLPGTGRIGVEIEKEVIRTAKALGIGHLLGRKPGQLSGGQRQRARWGGRWCAIPPCS